MPTEQDDQWMLAALRSPDGTVHPVDPMDLVNDAAPAEVTIAYAQSTMVFDGRPFQFHGPGWYHYQMMSVLVAPCARASGAGDQHFLFIPFAGPASIMALLWAAQAPCHTPEPAAAPANPSPATSGEEGSAPSFWQQAGVPEGPPEEPPPASRSRLLLRSAP